TKRSSYSRHHQLVGKGEGDTNAALRRLGTRGLPFQGAYAKATKHSFGWVPDLSDHRDFLYAAPVVNLAALPAKVDLTPQCPKEVYDQGQLGSCTANAIAGALEFDQIKEGDKSTFTPSRLFIYYNERTMEHTVNTDSGAQIRDGIKSVGSIGRLPKRIGPTTSRNSRKHR